MRISSFVLSLFVLFPGAVCLGQHSLKSVLTPFETRRAQEIILQNDGFEESGGQAVLQQGFIKGEKAGVWVKVPATISNFKVDYFRVLAGGQETRTQVFFEMGIDSSGIYKAAMPRDIVNAATITPGPYWNDIPAQGADGSLSCAKGGNLIGAAIEFTHDGVPSVYRDTNGITQVANTLFAIPGGWNFSSTFGLTGDWILRIVGHEANAGDCL